MTCLIMTLEEMLKLALGTTAPGHINVTILHSLLKIVIQKLEIQTDFVEISGPEACRLRQMLCNARSPLLEFQSCIDEDTTELRTNKVCDVEERMSRLTDVVEKMEADLRAHLDSVELAKKTPPTKRLKLRQPFAPREEDSFSSDCEDLCKPCDERNLIACDLLQNHLFVKKLMRRVTSPIIDRIFQFEKIIGMLNEKFQNFLNTAEDEGRKIPLIEDCLAQMDAIKKDLDKHQSEFIATMEEVQEMLDAKLDKVHMPALKKYISDRMDDIERQLADLVKREQCPKAAGVIMNNMQCLCCTTLACQKDRDFPVPLLASVVHNKQGKTVKTVAGGGLPRLCNLRNMERTCGGDHTVIRPGERSLKKSNLIDDFGDQLNLRLDTDSTREVKYFKGLDGGMYRLATQNGGFK